MLIRGKAPLTLHGERDASPIPFVYIGHVTGSIVLAI